MRKLILKHVGPINNTAKIIFRRYCILIGPQSNGKSTIAKILSTCLWLEKEACTTLSENVLPTDKDFKTFVEDYHRIHGYIDPSESVITYESPYVSIRYVTGKFTLSLHSEAHYKRSKVSYIPSDRNVITLRDIEKRDLEGTNFRSFLFDWLEARTNYDKNHRTHILNLDVQYYYDENATEKKDKIIHENGRTYDIPLYDASSGMQSVVPMTVLMHYLYARYYEVFGDKTSFSTEEKNQILTKRIFVKHLESSLQESGFANVGLYYRFLTEKSHAGDVEAQRICDAIYSEYKNLTHPHNILYVIEEPEQNLFPQTQLDLVKTIVEYCNGDHQNNALITTHSPYVLAAVNILMFAGKLKAMGVDADQVQSIVGTANFINPDDIELYHVSHGTCYSLKNKEVGLVNPNELDSASDYNADVFNSLYRLFTQKMQEQ